MLNIIAIIMIWVGTMLTLYIAMSKPKNKTGSYGHLKEDLESKSEVRVSAIIAAILISGGSIIQLALALKDI